MAFRYLAQPKQTYSKFALYDVVDVTGAITTNTYPRGDIHPQKNDLKRQTFNNERGYISKIEEPSLSNNNNYLYTICFTSKLYGVEVAEDKLQKVDLTALISTPISTPISAPQLTVSPVKSVRQKQPKQTYSKFALYDLVDVTGAITTDTYPRGVIYPQKNDLKRQTFNNERGYILKIEEPSLLNNNNYLYTICFTSKLYGVEVAEDKLQKVDLTAPISVPISAPQLTVSPVTSVRQKQPKQQPHVQQPQASNAQSDNYALYDIVSVTGEITTNVHPQGTDIKQQFFNNEIGSILTIENPSHTNNNQYIYTILFTSKLYGIKVTKDKLQKANLPSATIVPIAPVLQYQLIASPVAHKPVAHKPVAHKPVAPKEYIISTNAKGDYGIVNYTNYEEYVAAWNNYKRLGYINESKPNPRI